MSNVPKLKLDGGNYGADLNTSIAPYRFNNYNDVMGLRTQLSSRIDQAQSRRAISPVEASSLRNELNQIARQMNRQSVSGNFRNNNLVRRLESLDTRLNNMLSSRGSRWY